jgi:tetratricopeptide (TPR) repeat protein
VLWLDDLERYLGVGGLTPIQLARLLTGEGHHRVIVATIRTAEQARIAVEMAEDEAGRQLSRDARQVFDQAYPIRISRMFSNQEIDRAQARNWDSRIAIAVDHADSYGLAEYLAAGPQLLRDWQNARESSEGGNVRGAALIAAAVDIRRAGYTSPIPRSLLSQIHEHYLSDAEHVHLPREPEDQAWEWATCRRLAAAALLRPAGADAVEVFDYLVDTIQRQAGILRSVPGPIVEAAIAFADPAECDSLALTAYYQGRYALARQAWQNAYQSRSDDPALGPDHPDTLTSRNNLAIALVACGQFSEAEYEYRAVLKGRTRVLSPDDPRTLSTRSSLAETLHARGQMDEAEQELRAVLQDSAQVFGPEHPGTLSARSGLAGILHDRGQFDEAIQEYRALLEASTQLLGSDDPDTLVLRHNLARNLLDSGQLDEAEAENRAIAQIRSRTLGPDHPLTLTNRLNIALILHDRGLLSDARTENTAVLEASTRVLGPDHPQTLLTRSNLAEVLLELGQLDEAEREIQAVLRARTLVLGPDHPSTLIDRHYLARLLRVQGQLSQAERELRAVLEARTRVLGPDHPRTLNARNDLAEITLSRQSPIAEAGDPDQALPT